MLPQSEASVGFVPVLRSLAETSEVAIAQIDANGNWDAVAGFGITTYPHVMVFRGWGEGRVYRGVLSEKSVKSYVDRFVGFEEMAELDGDIVEEFKRSSEVVVVGRVGREDGDGRAAWESVARGMYPEVVFGVVEDGDSGRTGKDYMGVMVVCNNATDERCEIAITGDIEQMKASIRRAALPLIVDLYPEIHDDLLDLGIPFAYMFTESPHDNLHTAISHLARKHRERIQLSIAPASRTPSILADMHLQLPTPTLPSFAIRDPIPNLRYPMPPPPTTTSFPAFLEQVDGFISAFLTPFLQPTIKSAPLPPPSTSALIKVVGSTYAATVNDPTRDVLLTICIEQCAPCHRLFPVLEEVGEWYRAEEARREAKGEVVRKTTVATVLADKNDIGIRRVRAYPTIVLFAVGRKGAPVRYLGERTGVGIRGFVEANRALGGGLP